MQQTATFKSSLFDRLTDIELESKNKKSIEEFLLGLQNDLAALLNQRRIVHQGVAKIDSLAQSILTYGLPDLTHYNPVSEKDREEVRKILQMVIRLHEPRLHDIHVVEKKLAGAEDATTTMAFTIFATVKFNKMVREINLDSYIKPSADEFSIMLYPNE